MQFRIEQHFAGSLTAVESALTDPMFLERLASLPKLGCPTLLEQHRQGPVARQKVRYAFVGELSGAVRRVVDPERLTWVEDSTIDHVSHTTTFAILPDHYANLLRCRGTFELRAAPVGCSRLAQGTVEVSVPLVGRRVEAAIVSGLAEHAALEAEVMDEWLAAG